MAAGLKILACKMKKHDWKRVPSPDGKFEMWECSVCKAKKVNMDEDNQSSDEPEITVDELTGFTNRGGALDQIKTYLKSHKNENYTICMCDIDSFTNLNETKGRECGDLILKEVAEILNKEVSGIGTPCRWGGDEFLLLFPSMNGDEIYNKMFALREKIKARVLYYDGDGISVSMTFALNEYDFSGKIEAFVAEAEDKLKLGKQMGGDQVIF